MHKDVEVMAVFKSGGDIKPYYVLLDKGMLKVDYYNSTNRNYAGTPSIEFECKLEDNAEINLIYFIHNHIWKIKNAPTN